MSSSDSELFNLTEVDNQLTLANKTSLIQEEHKDRMEKVRQEHKKLQDVVENFRLKVDKMVGKQRLEYLQAYETHIQEIQKEIHSLRLTVCELANEQTKAERKEKLKAELDLLKSNALKYETESDELRSVVVNLVRKLCQIEKTRDWMFRKVDQAKNKYNKLTMTRTKLSEEIAAMSLEEPSYSSMSSSYTVDYSIRPSDNLKNTNNFSKSLKNSTFTPSPTLNKFDRNALSMGNIKRNLKLPSLNSSLPPPSLSSFQKSSNFKNRLLNTVNHATPNHSSNQTNTNSSTLNRSASAFFDDPTSNIIQARVVKKELRDFLVLCRGSLHKRPWSRVEKRPIEQLVYQGLTTLKEEEPNAELILSLACELAASPEVLDTLIELYDEGSTSGASPSPLSIPFGNYESFPVGNNDGDDVKFDGDRIEGATEYIEKDEDENIIDNDLLNWVPNF